MLGQPKESKNDARSQRASLSRERAREALLKASAELFLETGVENFSLRKAAERAGQSPGNVYNYFQDKEDLLRALAQEAVLRFNRAQVEAVRGIADPLERFFALGRGYIRFGMENPSYYRLLQRSDLLGGRVQPQDAAGEQNGFDLLVGALGEGMARGLLREQPLLPLAALSWSTVHGIVDLCLGPLGGDPAILPALQESMFETLSHGILKPKDDAR